MESIKPEKDEVDAYRGQGHRARPRTPDKAPAAAPRIPPEPTRAAPDKTLHLTRGAQLFMILLFLLVVCVSVMGAWQVREQQETIDSMSYQLTQARRSLEQSQLVVARLEGQVYQTDATMAQSGNELARELQKLDEGLRRLEQQGGKRMAALEKRLAATEKSSAEGLGKAAALQGEVSGLEPLLVGLEARISNLQVKLDNQATEVGALAPRLDGMGEQVRELQAGNLDVQTRLDEIGQTVATLNTQMGELQQAQESTRSAARQAASRAQLDSLQQTVNAIDATRNQLVQRFVGLDRKLNELSLEMESLRATQAGSRGKP